jgi:hypothetical protein
MSVQVFSVQSRVLPLKQANMPLDVTAMLQLLECGKGNNKKNWSTSITLRRSRLCQLKACT